jgi:Cu/Zn superoxide dismutase
MDTQRKLGAAALAAVMVTALVVACKGDNTNAPTLQTMTYVATMSGANEVPPVAASASGTATFTLTGKTLSYVVTVSDLSGNAAASHIHFGAANANGNIAYPFTAASVQSGSVASGSIDLTQPVSNGTTSITGDSLLTLLNNGSLYTNVHTAANPGGEIRGQIIRTQSSTGY